MASESLPVRLRAGFCRVVAATTALALATAGCGYRSTYVAPTDGRARVVWGPNDVPTVQMSGASISSECGTEIRQATDNARLPLADGHLHSLRRPSYPASGSEVWVPRYYGPRIVVIRPGVLPLFPRLPLFVPRLISPVPLPGGPMNGIGGIGRGGSGGGGGSSMGGGKGAGELVLVLLVISVVVLPAVALGLAASTPESSQKAADAIDLANAYNDLARLDGTPCSVPPPAFDPGGFAPAPPPPFDPGFAPAPLAPQELR